MRSVRVVSSSERACWSSGFEGDFARERMRRYEENRGLVVPRVERTSLQFVVS